MSRRIFQRLLLVVALSLCADAVSMLIPSTADAVRFRRPYDPSYRLGYGRDHDSIEDRCTDYTCRSKCYDGHSGNDFSLPFGTTVVAAAGGRVTTVNQGCNNYGYYGNTCGARCGNYVRIDHDDGTYALYCHMRHGTMQVRVGERVACGTPLGQSASSGSSTGPHLHFGFVRGGVSRDPYAGSCSGSTSYWVEQGSYDGLPSTRCERVCECSPGATQRRDCGRCGSQTRRCGSNCRWGGWSSCGGQGECAAGATQERDCCDCGRQSRRCSGSCSWGAWSDCRGPDPSPAVACDTGLLGVCADGTQRCESGCLVCRENTPAHDELCDALDNDCDGDADEGYPDELGELPPPLAARRIDASLPASLSPGERGRAWVEFENVGSETWREGEVFLRVDVSDPESAAAWFDEESWLAWDVPARLTHDVEPGERARLVFTVRAPDDAREMAPIDVALTGASGDFMACPSPNVGLDIAPLRSPGGADRDREGDGTGDKLPGAFDEPRGGSEIPSDSPDLEPDAGSLAGPDAGADAAADIDPGGVHTAVGEGAAGCASVGAFAEHRPTGAAIFIALMLLGIGRARRRRGGSSALDGRAHR